VSDWNPPQSQLDALRTAIGIDPPDPSDPLQAKLINALAKLGAESTYGQQVVTLRLVINWEHKEAGAAYAKAKAEYERLFTKAKLAALASDDPKMSVARAEIIAEADDDVYAMKLAYLLAEQYERTLRQFLTSLDKALDNHRTDRADWRASDSHHAAGIGGGA
jgi:hypothetical protein